MRSSSRSFFGLVSESYHVPTQPAGLVAVGINFALGLALLDVVFTNFPLFFGAAEELLEASDAAKFALALELPLACGRLPPFYVRLKDPKAF